MPEAVGNHSTSITRRALLSRGAVALPVATLAALPMAVAASSPVAAVTSSPVTRLGDVTADAELLSIFGRWIAQERAIEAITPTADDDEFVAAWDAADGLMREIAAMPTNSVTGLAVKVYLLAHAQYGGERSNILAVALPEQGDEGDDEVGDVLQRSVLADALRWLPALERA